MTNTVRKKELNATADSSIIGGEPNKNRRASDGDFHCFPPVPPSILVGKTTIIIMILLIMVVFPTRREGGHGGKCGKSLRAAIFHRFPPELGGYGGKSEK